MDAYVKANKDFMTWQKEDAKCLGLMLLKMIDKLQYLVGETAVKIILWLTWVTFTVGTRWSALGVGVGLGEGREG